MELMWMWIPFKAYTAHAVLIDIHEGYKQKTLFLSFHALFGGHGEGVNEEGDQAD